MKKRTDEKFTLLQKVGSYGIKLSILQSMYFKRIHKKHQISLWIYYPDEEEKIVKTNNQHEVRTEKDIIRYFTTLCSKFNKKHQPLEEKRKMCIVNFKGDKLTTLNASQLLETIKFNLYSVVSVHFFTDNSMQDTNFTYYQFALRLDEDKSQAHRAIEMSKESAQKLGKGAGINHLIRGYGLDKDEYDYHLVEISENNSRDIWNNSNMHYKAYNFASNLLYILEKRDNLVMEKMNFYFVLDNQNNLTLFDIDKCLSLQKRKPKTQKDEYYFIDCLKPETSLLPPTFKEKPVSRKLFESEDERKKRMKRMQESMPKQKNFIIKNIKTLRNPLQIASRQSNLKQQLNTIQESINQQSDELSSEKDLQSTKIKSSKTVTRLMSPINDYQPVFSGENTLQLQSSQSTKVMPQVQNNKSIIKNNRQSLKVETSQPRTRQVLFQKV